MSIAKPANYLKHNRGVGFTTIINETLLSIRHTGALGVYTYLASKPEDWQIYKNQLQDHFQCGRDHIETCLKYLRDLGLLESVSYRDEAGRITHWSTYLHYTIPQNTEKPKHDENIHNTEIPYSSTEARKPSVYEGFSDLNHNTENPHCGNTPSTNKRNKQIKEKNKRTASGTLFSNQLSASEKEALALLKSKFNDKRITIKQLRDLLKVHTHKDLKRSVDNYLYDLENQTEKVSNKIVVFTMRLKTQGKGYYEDSRNYHSVDTDRLPEDMQKPKLKIDLPVQKLTLVKNDSINEKKREALAYECFKKWQRHAPNSLYERYGENIRAFFDYFKTKVFPHLTNNDITALCGHR